MLCQVCKETTSKYKCSNCYSPYCSLTCWKSHKSEDNCEPIEEVKKEEPLEVPRDKYFTTDTVSNDKLSKLGESEVLRKILKNKYLQNILINLDCSLNPEKSVYEAMKIPDFVEFVDECLKIVED